MDRRTKIRRPAKPLSQIGVFLFGLWWGILVGMTLIGCLLEFGGR